MDSDPQGNPAAEADPEGFWAEVLSADPERVRRAFDRLDPVAAGRVLEHLRRMARETDYQPAQRNRARAALDVLKKRPPTGGEEKR